MSITRLASPGLFIYECIRLLFVAHEFSAIQPAHPGAFPWITYMAANAFFPIMAFFVWHSFSRYKAYLPLFIAGKCIIIFLIAGWILSFSREILLEQMTGSGFLLMPLSAAGILFLGDAVSIACAFIIHKKSQKAAIDAGHGA